MDEHALSCVKLGNVGTAGVCGVGKGGGTMGKEWAIQRGGFRLNVGATELSWSVISFASILSGAKNAPLACYEEVNSQQDRFGHCGKHPMDGYRPCSWP